MAAVTPMAVTIRAGISRIPASDGGCRRLAMSDDEEATVAG